MLAFPISLEEKPIPVFDAGGLNPSAFLYAWARSG
jgi:hypothetical protein